LAEEESNLRLTIEGKGDQFSRKKSRTGRGKKRENWLVGRQKISL